ncbi:Gfo/Idh/MocA family protein [Rhodobium gokarnense]|nr:Gfo/Idh/MocA family oxidoreductase [Rhodobium gokarnense]
MEKVRWGILSTAKIGLEKVIPAIKRSRHGVVAAIASRAPGPAEEAAKALGIDTAYGSYEELLADPDIDAVYNPLPNHLHVPVTLAAARAGKHVLCEKPIALTAAEAEELKSVPKDRLVMEAFMVRFHPQWLRLRELVRSGALGEVWAVQSFFSYSNRNPDDIRNRAEIGGGALYDIGCYPVTAGRFVFEAEPVRVVSLVERDPDFGTDRLSSALIDFGAGRRLDFTVSTQATPYQRLQVVGTKKRAEVLIPYNAPQGAEALLRLDDGSTLGDGAGVLETVPASDQYAEEADAFALAVRGETELPYGVDDAIANMRVLDALFRSEKSNAWETVGG